MTTNGHKLLSIEEMLAAEDVSYTTVPVPEWGGEVKFASVDAGTMLDYIEANNKPGGQKDSMIRLVVRSLIDIDGVEDSGLRVKPEDVESLVVKYKGKDIRIMNRLCDAALKLNNVSSTPDAIKNVLGEAPTDASPTA